MLGHALPSRGDKEGWHTIYHLAISVAVVHGGGPAAPRLPATAGAPVPAGFVLDTYQGVLTEPLSRDAHVPHAEGKVKQDSLASSSKGSKKRPRHGGPANDESSSSAAREEPQEHGGGGEDYENEEEEDQEEAAGADV